MTKNRAKEIPYSALRKSLVAFLLLLAAAAAGIWLYPKICMRIGERAASRGDTEKAVQWLSRAGDGEQAEELLINAKEQEIGRLLGEEQYEEALKALEELSVTDPADERVSQCLYGIAVRLMQQGRYAEAEKEFSKVLTYRDAAQNYLVCIARAAQDAFEAGDYPAARDYIAKNPQDSGMQELETQILKKEAEELLLSDTPEKGLKIVFELWQKGKASDAELVRAEKASYPYLYADMTEEEILETARQTSAEQAERQNERIRKRNELPGQVLAAGTLHTVAVKEDGTVLSAGDNSYGQCDVSGWTDITAVAAGAYHTVGLKKDGTVVATGDNRYGQCDTKSVSGAVEIEAHGFDTVVRLADGTILCFGAHDYGSQTAGWTGITDLSAGGFALIGVTEDGTAMATSSSLLTQEFRNLIAADAATTYAAGITSDGRIVTSALLKPAWEDVLLIDAEANGIMALLEDGSVRFALLSEMDTSALEGQNDIAAIAFSGTHAVVLRKDGTYLACGENGAGQCNVSAWRRNG